MRSPATSPVMAPGILPRSIARACRFAALAAAVAPVAWGATVLPIEVHCVPVDPEQCAGNLVRFEVRVPPSVVAPVVDWKRNGQVIEVAGGLTKDVLIQPDDHGAIYSATVRTATDSGSYAFAPLIVGASEFPTGGPLQWLSYARDVTLDWRNTSNCVMTKNGWANCVSLHRHLHYVNYCHGGRVTTQTCRIHASSSSTYGGSLSSVEGQTFTDRSETVTVRAQAPQAMIMKVEGTASGWNMLLVRVDGAPVRQLVTTSAWVFAEIELPPGELEIVATARPPGSLGDPTHLNVDIEFSAEGGSVSVPGDHPTIQAAIDAAPLAFMRVVNVAPGVHEGPVDFKGKSVVVRGAGAGLTTIVGGGGQSVVRFSGGEPAAAGLESVTVRGGTTGSPLPAAPQYSVGGGIFSNGSRAGVRDCVIEYNEAPYGGGAYFWQSECRIERCTFRDNAAGADGGGLQAYGGDVEVEDCVFVGNFANSRGGGMHLVQGSPTLTRVAVTGNSSANVIGGVSWNAVGSAQALLAIEDSSVTGNASPLGNGGIGITDTGLVASTVTLRETTVCSNLPRPNLGGGRWTDLGGNTVCDCAGDLNLDGAVNGADLGLMLAVWGPCGASCAYDLSLDGLVNGADLGLLLSAWGPCGG